MTSAVEAIPHRSNDMANHYLVTGAAGFIGSRTAQLLLDRGDLVTGVDDLNDYYLPALKEQRLAGLQQHPGFRFIRADIGLRDELPRCFDTEYHAVFNLAARAGVRYSTVDPWIYLQTNITGTLNLLEAMRAAGISRMITASTSSLYAGSPLPYHEEQPVNRPLSPYAASKKGAEALCYSYHHLYGISVNICRYFTVYGPAGRPDMSYYRFIHWIATGTPIRLYGDGTQSRDFTFVDDIASGTVRALRPDGYNIINLGGGNNPVSILEMITVLEELLGKKAVINRLPEDPADMKTTMADIRKAKELLGWEPQTPLRSGLEQCVEWYRQNTALVAASLAE